MQVVHWCSRLTLGLAALSLALALSCSGSSGAHSSQSSPQRPDVPFHQDGEATPDGKSLPDVGDQSDGKDPNRDAATSAVPFKRSRARSLPAGTLLTVRLENTLSSAKSDSDSVFTAVVDVPVVINGDIFVPPGTRVQGHVETARVSDSDQQIGYFRLSLDSILMDGKDIPVQTSSLFAKGTVSAGHDLVPGNNMNIQKQPSTTVVRLKKGRRMTFRLTNEVVLNTKPEPPAKSLPNS